LLFGKKGLSLWGNKIKNTTMKTMIIEYNENNRYARQVLTGLIGSGIIRRKNATRSPRISAFKAALQETITMSADIAQNGTKRYKTLDDLLNED
jgi:hypothetical protein